MLQKFNDVINPTNQKIYVKTHNKVRADVNMYSYEEAKDFDQIAWWVHKDYVVIDVDIKSHANILYKLIKGENLKCHIFRSVKGAHFVFKQHPQFPVPQVTKTYGAVGLQFDTRTTGKGYIVLPHKQKDRKWVRIIDGPLDYLPMYLYPQKKLTSLYKDSIINEKTNKKSKVDVMPAFNEMGDGDGRNDTLFLYFTRLLKSSINLTIEQKREAVILLNKYVLKEPLRESELDSTVLREELTENLKDDEIDHGKELDPDIVANKIIMDHDIITKNDQMFMYSDGYYRPLHEPELHYLIHHKYDKRAKDFKRNEIVKFVRVKTDIRNEQVNKEAMMINVENGRINLQTQELTDHNETKYDTIRVPHKYNRSAKPSKVLKKFLRFISGGDRNKLQLIFEMIGLTLVKKPIIEAFFVLVGEKGANGKSTLLEIIENLLSIDNVSNLDIGEFAKDEYAAYELYSKLANIGDDLKQTALKDTGLIKTLTSGKSLNAAVKYRPRFKFKNFATMIFAANRMPITYDKSGGFYRRIVIIRFNGSIPAGQRDPFLIDKLTKEDYEYMLKRAVKAVANVINTNKLTELQESIEEKDHYKKENSSILTFLEEQNIGIAEIDLHSVQDLYNSYKEFCSNGGYKVLQKGIFDSEISSQFNVIKKTTTKNGVANKRRWVIRGE